MKSDICSAVTVMQTMFGVVYSPSDITPFDNAAGAARSKLSLSRSLVAALAAAFLMVSPSPAHAEPVLQPAFSVFAPRGPMAAPGVVIFSHGRSVDHEDSESPAPLYLRTLAADGWDVLRFDRQRSEDTLSASAAALIKHVHDLRARGYARIVLAGQSFGGFLSLMSAADSTDVDAVIATAPAAYGTFGGPHDNWKKNASELYRILDRIDHSRVLLAFFLVDEYDPGGRAERAEAILTRHGIVHAVLDQPAGLFGHAAASSSSFSRSYADCLEAFIAAGRFDPPACSHQDPMVQIMPFQPNG
jgi:pimeloyl-ACP methyl ester carboxylesterase